MLVQGAIYERRGIVRTADDYARKFSTPKVDHWIRTEHLAEDLSAAFELGLDAVRKALTRKNETGLAYVKSLSFWFTDEELSSLYAANPIWTQIEKEVYGSLLVNDNDRGASCLTSS
jgi:hypothetical protein